jgi:hypothetical protein
MLSHRAGDRGPRQAPVLRVLGCRRGICSCFSVVEFCLYCSGEAATKMLEDGLLLRHK